MDFSQARITEHIAFSHFEGYSNGQHPFEGVTVPCTSKTTSNKYSWVKAPRYDDLPSETGPLAELIIGKDPLFTDLVRDKGPSAFSRQLARIVRPAKLLPIMKEIIQSIDPKALYYTSVKGIPDGRSYGIIEAPRGILGHWLEIRNGVIDRYQIITPTSWNGSPRDANGVRGPWEESAIGVEVIDPENPVEIGHIVRSFDPCQVCAVHRLNRK
jgi:hydrogenase large subunit